MPALAPLAVVLLAAPTVAAPTAAAPTAAAPTTVAVAAAAVAAAVAAALAAAQAGVPGTVIQVCVAVAFLVGLATTLTRSMMIGFTDVLPVYILMGLVIFMMIYEAFIQKK